MFRSSLLVVAALVCSQPVVAVAGGSKPNIHHHGVHHVGVPQFAAPNFAVPHVAVPNIALPHFNLPGSFVPPHFPKPHFPQPNFPQTRLPQINGFRFKHFETYTKWQSNRRVLGNPIGHETSIFSSRIQGSTMRFEYGYIVRHTSGRTFIVRGEIGQAWMEAGGVYGKLGMPKGNDFEFNAQGHDAQVFQNGLIFWNAKLNEFAVGPKA
jgi:hypothetical protein